jgi:DNA-directed RNA polymerase subunit A'
MEEQDTMQEDMRPEADVEETEVFDESTGPETEVVEDTDIEVYRDFVFKKIDTIMFGVLSPKMMKKLSSVKIVTPELYDKEGYPVDGGLMDIRLGVIDPGLKCKTCGSKLKECQGHFGYIELARPVIHIKFIDMIYMLLQTTCRECSRVLINQRDISNFKKKFEGMSPDDRKNLIKAAVAKSKNKCPHCNAKQYKVSLEKPTTFLENEKRINPIEIRIRLEKITDEDSELFGYNPLTIRPEWMILTILPIPPVTMRPSITLESGERSEDDLTHKMGDIVRINQRLFENINAGAPEIIIEDLWDLLQYHITTFFDNDVAQLPPARHRSGQPLKTITERIKSKEGRIRHNLAGKRTNFSARTVISPDSRLAINEVGVPQIMAKKLTVPEMVNEWNIDYLKRFVENGPDEYPGANYVIRPDGRKKKITEETREQAIEELQPGYIVERHLMNNDVALFNRQPSLHRMSMMCHKVKVLPGKTLRLNPAVCHPYNADFDGDEMNLHIPQTEEARAEAEILMEVQTQLISPRFGLSVIGAIQDAISGNYILTRFKNEIPREEAVDMLISIGVEDLSDLPNKKILTGKEIFSILIPKDFSFKGKSKANNEEGDKEVIMENGRLIKGVMDKANLGEGSGLMLRNIHKIYGPAKTIKILERIIQLGIETLTREGFSTTISDTDLPRHARDLIDEEIQKGYDEVEKMIADFKAGTLEPLPGRSLKETLELRILELLNKVRNTIGSHVQEHCDKTTHTIIMADSGARGNPINLAQMAACIGQQAFRGGRIEKGYANRTLSHFKKGELGPDAHGFVSSSFKKGTKPFEFFFLAMTGRDSLINTTLRTPKSGYLYRRLANALQDIIVEYDYTVRDASKKIIQFSYGEDGIDVSKSENGSLNVKRIIEQNLG